jgi:uncharacterized membrane protein YebE (DUF533 family)
MIDPKRLLEQVLGSGMSGGAGDIGRQLKNKLDATRGPDAFAGGAVAGGLLGMLLSGGRRRRFGGFGGGGAAILGLLAMQAYQNYQRQQAGRPPAPAPTATDVDPATLPHAHPAADGGPFELVLVRAMIGAAKADGHIDELEQRRLFKEVERLGLDAETKAYVFDLLTHDIDLDSLASAVDRPEQGAELYLAARLAIDPDQPAERSYLDGLAARLRLPAELRESLEAAPKKVRA